LKKLAIYLAGPIGNYPKDLTHFWRQEVECEFAGDKTVKIYNPCHRDYSEQPMKKCYIELVEQDLEDIRNSDILLINPNLPMSEGTPMEMVYGKIWNKINLLVKTEHVGAWSLYHADMWVESVAKAVQIIKAWNQPLSRI